MGISSISSGCRFGLLFRGFGGRGIESDLTIHQPQQYGVCDVDRTVTTRDDTNDHREGESMDPFTTGNVQHENYQEGGERG